MSTAEDRQTIFDLSHEMFAIAKRAVESGEFSADVERARAINEQLTGLWQIVEETPAPDQIALSQAWTEARLDAGYVLSGGALPTSTRLFVVLRDLPDT